MTLPRLFVQHADPNLSRILRETAQGRYVLTPCNGWEHLAALLWESPPGAFAVVDPLLEGNGRVWAGLPGLVRGSPGATVMAAIPMPPGGKVLRALREAVVAGIILQGHDDTPEGLRQSLRHARGRAFQGIVNDILPHYVSGRRRRLILAAAEAVCAGGRSEDYAAVTGVSESTLLRYCAQNALPPPRRLLAWLRVLLAARLLDDGRRVQDVARASGYAAESPLRTALRELVGESASGLRARGALESVSRALLRELLERRESAREERRPGEPAADPRDAGPPPGRPGWRG